MILVKLNSIITKSILKCRTYIASRDTNVFFVTSDPNRLSKIY